MIWMILLCEMPILRIVSGGKNIFRRNYSLPGGKKSNILPKSDAINIYAANISKLFKI